MTTYRLNDKEREYWILNTGGLYWWWQTQKKSLSAFIRAHRKDIDDHIHLLIGWTNIHSKEARASGQAHINTKECIHQPPNPNEWAETVWSAKMTRNMLTPLTSRQITLIVNNVVAACADITKLNKRSYDFLYLASGFIAHYDLYGFIDFLQGPLTQNGYFEVSNPEPVGKLHATR